MPGSPQSCPRAADGRALFRHMLDSSKKSPQGAEKCLYFVSAHGNISKLTKIHAGRIPQAGARPGSPREQKKTAEEKPNMEEKT